MLEAIEFIASIFKRRLKLTRWEEHQVMCSRVDGNRLDVFYKKDHIRPEPRPYALVVNVIDEGNNNFSLKHHCMVIPNIIHHEISIGSFKYSDNYAGDDMYRVTTVDATQQIKQLYFKKELLKSVY